MANKPITRVELTGALSELKLKDLIGRQAWAIVCDAPFHEMFRQWGIDETRLISADEVMANGDTMPLPDMLLICTETPERNIQHKIRDRGLKTVGLFSQLFPRLSAGLPPRWRPNPNLEVKLEYAIMCLPRCGSTLVSRELKELGGGNPNEHFRGPVQTLLKNRDISRFDFSRWWAMVRDGHNINGVFSTKLIYDFWKMAEQFMERAEIEEVHSFLRNVPVIHIERTDKFDQAASDAIARQTGVWHLWSDDMKAQYDQKLAGLDGNLQEAIQIYRKFRRHEKELHELLEFLGSKVIRIDYRDLMTEPKATIARAARDVGLDVPESYLSSPLSLQPTTSDVHRRLRDRLEEELR